MAKRKMLVRLNSLRPGDSFVEWPDRQLGSEREGYFMREIKPLPTKVGSMIVDQDTIIYVLSERGFWISLTDGKGYEPRRFEYLDWKHYERPPITVESVKASITRYAEKVERYNGRSWITDLGRTRIAEVIVNDINGTGIEHDIT